MIQIEDLMNRSVAINCRTQEQANLLSDILFGYGINNHRNLSAGWDFYREETCYRIIGNKWSCQRRMYWVAYGCAIIEFDELMREEY